MWLNLTVVLALLSLGLASELHVKTFLVGDKNLVLKHTISSTSVTFEVEADTLGYLVLGFGHNRSHDASTVYDSFVGGVKDGNSYGASYTLKGDKLTRNKDDRFKISSGSESGGKTKLTITRDISTCFWESFDWRDVGDTALVFLAFGSSDLDKINPTPDEIDIRTAAASSQGQMTLFSHTQTKADQLTTALTGFEKKGTFMNGERIRESLTLCKVFSMPSTAQYYKGFMPDFSPTSSKDKIRLMTLYQCDNVAIKNSGQTPNLNGASNDECRTGVGVTDLHKYCKDILFAWAPGSEGEALLGDKGVQANQADNGNRYVMLTIAYDISAYNDDIADKSGMEVYHSSSSSYSKVSKLMVGHHVSSKMVIMRSQNWVVRGICPHTCTGDRDLTNADKMNVISAGIYHSNALGAKIMTKTEGGYKNVIMDLPASSKFKPNRILPQSGVSLDLGYTDIVTECTFASPDQDYQVGGFRDKNDFCFGILTLDQVLPLSTCTSVPSELNLETTLGLRLLEYEDAKRKRRKRQSDRIILGFEDRELIGGGKVKESLASLGSSLKGDQANADKINQNILNSHQVSFCVKSRGAGTSVLKEQRIANLADANPPVIEAEANCKEQRGVQERKAVIDPSGRGSAVATHQSFCSMLMTIMTLVCAKYLF